MMQEIKEYLKTWLSHNAKILRELLIIIVRDFRIFLIKVPMNKLIPANKYRKRPEGYYYSVKDYLQKNSNSKMFRVYLAQIYQRKMPHTFDEKIHPIFLENLTFKMPDINVYELFDIRFWGHYGGSIITGDNKLIADLSPDQWELGRHKIFTKILLPKPAKLNGTTAILSTPEAENNYWHWTFDLLPRLHYLEKAGFGPDDIDHYLVNHHNYPYQLESLKYCGIPTDKIIRVDHNTHFKIARGIITDLKPDQLSVTNNECDYLRSIPYRKIDKVNLSKYIYVSRQNCKRRKVINEELLVDKLKNYGFEVIFPDQYSIADQKQIFENSEIIIGPYGASMTNLVFCKESTLIINLLTSKFIDLAIWSHASIQNQNYYYLTADQDSMDYKYARDRRADIIITNYKLKQLLAFLDD